MRARPNFYIVHPAFLSRSLDHYPSVVGFRPHVGNSGSLRVWKQSTAPLRDLLLDHASDGGSPKRLA